MGRGATNQTELSRDTIASLPFLNPPHEIAVQFELIKDEIAHQMQNLIRQNVALIKARDLLLPRLMNGEIAV
jgi:type I restriction enzyme S subunit